jgi:ubiquinone/menaquinone biosynthesis C-methylase UbiE
LLEIGTGSGGIAHYFATHKSIRCDVAAVDVVDQRLLRDKFKFVLIEDTALPFANGSFDVVISNHVIEHVGNRDAQYHHLSEIHRVLKMDGVGYLAVPNRWMLVEPHYKLIFLKLVAAVPAKLLFTVSPSR